MSEFAGELATHSFGASSPVLREIFKTSAFSMIANGKLSRSGRETYRIMLIITLHYFNFNGKNAKEESRYIT